MVQGMVTPYPAAAGRRRHSRPLLRRLPFALPAHPQATIPRSLTSLDGGST